MSEVNLNNALKTEGRLSRPSTPSRARTDRAAQRTFFIITFLFFILLFFYIDTMLSLMVKRIFFHFRCADFLRTDSDRLVHSSSKAAKPGTSGEGVWLSSVTCSLCVVVRRGYG